MLRATVPFAAGLLLGDRYPVPLPYIGVATVVAFALCLFLWGHIKRYRHRWMHGALLAPVLILLGLFWQRLHTPEERPGNISQLASRVNGCRALITEVISTGARTTRVWAELEACRVDSDWRDANGTVLLTLMKDSAGSTPAVGDRTLMHARVDTIDRVPDPGGFDQRQWAASYGASHQCFAPAGSWQVLSHARGWTALFEGARERIVVWLRRSGLRERERGMVKAILLGIRDELEQDQKTAFSRSGTMHVLAVSGSHVALVYGVLLWSLSAMGNGRRWRVVRSVLLLLVLWAYAGLTGFTPSVLRATLTFTFFCIADMTRWRTEPLNSLAASAFLLLLWDPVMLFQLSFQLSFLAVLGIALFYWPIMQAWAPPYAWMRYFWSLVAVSLAAQAFTTPLSLLSFKGFPVWFLPANMVIVGLVAIGVYGGALLLLLQWVPYLSDWITYGMEKLLELLGWTSSFFAGLPGAYPDVRISVWQCAGLYAFVLLFAAWIFERWRWARAGTLLVSFALLLSWGWIAHGRDTQQHFVVYDDRGKMTCAIEEGRSLTVFTDSVDVWTRRKIDQHMRSEGLRALRVIDSVPMLVQAPVRVAFMDAAEMRDSTQRLDADITVLTTDGHYPVDRLTRSLDHAGTFVISPLISAAHRRYLLRWFQDHDLTVHDIRSQGAYVR